MSVSYQPVSAEKLPTLLADTIGRQGWQVVGLDADPVLGVAAVADRVAEELKSVGRPVLLADTADWWRPASVRLEYGLDPTTALSGWFDDNALMRELIRPLRSGAPALTRFWDPLRDRSYRDRPQPAPAEAVLLLSGPFLQYLFLELDAVIRFSVSERTLARRLPADRQWWLPAHATYRQACPDTDVDVLIAYDHPATPALRR